MNTPSVGSWGTGTSVLTRISPAVRAVTGVVLVAAAMVSDMATAAGFVASAATIALVLFLARPAARTLARAAVAILVLSPVFLLSPWTATVVPERVLPGVASMVVPWRIFTTAASVLMVSLALTSAFTRSDLREALVHLPLPRLMSAILLMIVFQTEAQLREVERILLAMQARGFSRTWRRPLAIARAIPQSWLPRLVARAERVTRAMEMRGYDGSPVSLIERKSESWDLAAVTLAVGWLGVVAAIRWGAA